MTELNHKIPAPVFPHGAAPLRSLTVTMAVMCYLACLAIGALVLVQRATDAWTQGLSREVTVQLRDISGVDQQAEAAKAVVIIKGTKGVRDAALLDKAQSAKLLQPWLGSAALDDLPLPRLIRVTVDETAPPDFAKLAAQLSEKVKGASLDTHQRWQAELSRLGHALVLLASLVLALIVLASIVLVAFAARGVMQANRDIVQVLELVGAEPKFISRQNDRQFLVTGLVAGGIGLLGGLLTFLALGWAGGVTGDGLAEAGRSLLFAPDAKLQLAAGLLLVPVISTLIALWTSRMTLVRILRQST